MVEIIDTGIPQKTNNRIIDMITAKGQWTFARDLSSSKGNDEGMLMTTWRSIPGSPEITDTNSPINSFAFVIYDIITSKCRQKFSSLNRIMWNVYWKSISKTDFHYDETSHKYFTFIYNLHDNDGGTEVKIGKELNFYPSKSGQAIVFPSHLEHRGVEPKTQDRRFSVGFIASF